METEPGAQEASPSLHECPHCGSMVPPGTFCGNCGSHFVDPGGRERMHHYAAAPGEHVARMAVITTLFPHLPHRHSHIFREVFVGGLAVVVLLAALHVYTPALVLAAVLLPVLYLIYLFEVEVYEQEPLLVLAATFVLGAALGVGYTLVVSQLITGTLHGTVQGPLITGVLLPVIVQVLMLIGPLLLIGHRSFNETLDGLTFGVTSALGFTVAAVLTSYWHVLTVPLVGSATISTEEIADFLRAGVLVALVNASTTGIITSALWLARRGNQRQRHAHPARGVPASLLIGFGAQILLGVLAYYIGGTLPRVVIWLIAAGVLLVWLRILLHFALLDEAAEQQIGPPSACPECHHLVPTMAFCPSCGVARSASPKHTRGGGMETVDVAG